MNERSIPKWLADLLVTKITRRWTGSLTICFSDGGVRNVHRETEVTHPPKKVEAFKRP